MKPRMLVSLFVFPILLLAACGPAATSPAPSLPPNTGAPVATAPVIASATAAVTVPSTATANPPSGPDGAALLQERCTVCHTLTRVTSSHRTVDGWRIIVLRMVGKGARLNEQEQQTLIEYLAQTYP